MVKIEIVLILNEGQIPFLSIPHSDVKRLAVFPFRWIRYVIFAICGARGNLSTTSDPDGPPVDYDRSELPDAQDTYYYRPSENIAFVDTKGLNDRITSTARTPRSHHFRDRVKGRDGCVCVFSRVEGGACEAAHLIPKSKGPEYIAKVIQLRSPRDNPAPPSNVEIDDIANGIFISRNLHSLQGDGVVAFIKTPNYGLRPEDIRRFQRGGSGPDYITLQWMKEPASYNPTTLAGYQQLGAVEPSVALDLGANVDAHFQSGRGSPISTVILNHVYGVAAYKSWCTQQASSVMNEYREEHYAHIPPVPRRPSDDTDNTDNVSESSGSEYQPRNRSAQTRRGGESDLAKAMDDLNVFLMFINGITPEEAAKRRQEEVEREERAAQEASRNKVIEWRQRANVF